MAKALGLGELVDLEMALREGHGPEAWPHRPALAPLASDDRSALLRCWLDAVYGEAPRPGQRLGRVLTLMTLGLTALGAVLGSGAARYALHYDGTHPVNVVTFLALLILPQLALLALMALQTLLGSLTLRRAADRSLGVLHHGLLALARSRTSLPPPGPDLGALYRPAEAWRLFGATQLFGVAFNLAAAGTALGLVTVTDLAFSWSTTLRVEADEAHRVAATLGAPFPRLVPSPEVVAETRYYRLDGRYAGGRESRAVDLAATAAWWPFLAACLLAYGLLPRVLLAALAYGLYRRHLARAPLGAYEVERLLRGLKTRSSGFQRAGSEEAQGGPLPPLVREMPRSQGPGVALIWRGAPWSDDAVRDFVAARAGMAPVAVLRPTSDFEGEETARRLPPGGPVYVLVDSFEALQKALIRFVRGLRAQIGPRRLIVLLPVEEAEGRLVPPADAGRRRYWRGAVQELSDAFIGTEVGEDIREDSG